MLFPKASNFFSSSAPMSLRYSSLAVQSTHTTGPHLIYHLLTKMYSTASHHTSLLPFLSVSVPFRWTTHPTFLCSADRARTNALRAGGNAAASNGMARRAAGKARSASSATSGTLSVSPTNTSPTDTSKSESHQEQRS